MKKLILFLIAGFVLAGFLYAQDPPQNLFVTEEGYATWEAPAGGLESFSDDFEAGVFADGWELIQGSGNYWQISANYAYQGAYGAYVPWGYTIDTWLITPEIEIGANHVVSFAWESSYYWSVDPYDNCDLFIQVSTDGGTTWNSIWTFGDIGVWVNWTWYETSLDLSAYAGQTVLIGFNEVGDDNADVGIDNVYVGPAENRTIGTYPISEPAIAAIDAKEVQRLAIRETEEERDFLGYNVYLDGVFVYFTTDLFYQYTDLVYSQTYLAEVTALYDEGESDPIEYEFIYLLVKAGDVVVAATELKDNYPNPFNPVTNIAFSLCEPGHVTLEVYNINGEIVRTLVNKVLAADDHEITWDGKDNTDKSVASGVYFYKMISEGNSGEYTSTKKMILLK